MDLIIDIGNSNIVFAVFDNNNVIEKWRIESSIYKTTEDYFVSIKTLVKQKYNFERIGIASVVPKISKVFMDLCIRFLNINPVFLTQINAQVEVMGNMRVGADVLGNVIAAANLFPEKELLIIDIGTATTFDIVSKKGSYCGGVIAPGPESFAMAFVSATSLLPRITTLAEAKKVVGSDILSAMESGMFWGYISLIEGMISKINCEEGKDFFVIATGGFSMFFMHKVQGIHCVDVDLTLKGIQLSL